MNATSSESDQGFNLQPSLQGTLVKVSPLLQSDNDELFLAAKDPLIWEQHPDRNRYKEGSFKCYFDDAIASGGAMIVRKSGSNEVIGATRFHGFDPDQSEIEIGWTFLVRECWGGLYNKELKYLLIQYAFNHVKNVVFLIDRNNTRSKQSVVKLGASQDGVRTKNGGTEMLVYKITKDVYLKNE